MHICTIFLPWYFSSPVRRRLFICFFPFIFFTISHLKHLTDSTGSTCFFFLVLGFSFFSLPNQHTLPGREIASCSHLLLVLHHPFVCAVVFFHPQLTTTKPSYPWWDFRGKSIAYQHNCFSSPHLPSATYICSRGKSLTHCLVDRFSRFHTHSLRRADDRSALLRQPGRFQCIRKSVSFHTSFVWKLISSQSCCRRKTVCVPKEDEIP